MIFTLRSNQARIERAEKAAESKLVAAVAAKAAANAVKAAAEAEERIKAAVAARQQAWEGWNERRLAAEGDSRPFTESPPGTISGVNGNGSV